MAILCGRYVALLQTNETTGRAYPNSSAWSLGRAWVDPRTQLWQTMFSKDGVEWNASHLVSPMSSNVSILGYQEPLLDKQGESEVNATSEMPAACCRVIWPMLLRHPAAQLAITDP